METKNATPSSFTFPVGYFPFSSDKNMNFQLNRWHSLGYWRQADAELAGSRIQGLGDWKRELVALAGEMEAEDRQLAAAITYRAAEFYTHPSDPDKIPLYNQFYERFYQAVQDEQMLRFSIPYGRGAACAALYAVGQQRGYRNPWGPGLLCGRVLLGRLLYR